MGRWQPFHEGHDWLIRQKLDAGTPVLIAVRPTDEWLTTAQVVSQISTRYVDDDVIVFTLPVDIESINYGRGVGYDIIEHTPPSAVADVSGTAIRAATNPT